MRAEFDAKDKIDIGSLESLCPCLADYFKKLFKNDNIDGDNWLCKFMEELDESDLDFQGFEIVDKNGFHNRIEGYSEGNVPLKGTIEIPRAACEGTFVKDDVPVGSSTIGAMFIHEFLHFHLVILARTANPDGVPNDLNILKPIPGESGTLLKVVKPEFYNKLKLSIL